MSAKQKEQTKARVVSLATFLPDHVLTNRDLEKMVNTSDEWICARTGMEERRIASPDETTASMGAKAAEAALEKVSFPASSVEMILTATMTPDYIFPSTAGLIQKQLNAYNAASLDIEASCSGFLYALSIAKAYIESGIYSNVLIVATEKMSSCIDYTDRNTCVLFGDGAAAALVRGEGAGLTIDNICLGSDGSLAHLLYMPAGGSLLPASSKTVEERLHYLKMEGKELFKHAIRRLKQTALDILKKSQLSMAEIQWIVPHQANIRILEALSHDLAFPWEKIYRTLRKYGNTSASSVAIALKELVEKEHLSDADKILLLVFGAGLTWGSALLTKVSS